jgi:hypothetical protein
MLKYGAEGYALYWLCLELIADTIDKNNISFELEHDSETLGARLSIDTLRVEEIMRYLVTLNLFEDDGGRITCLKLASRLENSIVKSDQMRVIQHQIRENPGQSGKIPARLEENRIEENRRSIYTIPDNPGQSRTDEDESGRIGINDYPTLLRQEWEAIGDRVYQPANPIAFLSTWGRDVAPFIKGYHSDDVLAAIANFGKVVGKPGSWWQAKVGISKFFQSHLEKFIPANFKAEDFRKDDGDEEDFEARLERIRRERGTK